MNDPESYKAHLKGKDAVFVNADCESSFARPTSGLFPADC